MPVTSACPSDRVFQDLLAGLLPAQQASAVSEHVRTCPRCASRSAGPKYPETISEGVGQARNDTNAPVDRPRSISSEPNKPSASPADQEKAAVPSLGFLGKPEGPDELGRLGPYRVLKVLGQGGMGMVLQAKDSRLGRLCALKVMLPEVAQRPHMKERFLREARAAAAIEHDHIIPIYQVDEHDGVPYIAMPFLKGASLEDWFRGKQKDQPGSPLTVPQILKLGREIARGLAAAHDRGMIHRDIKPANVWLDSTTGGRVKILDFGLARLSEGAGEQHLTQTGAIMGTPAYMAPEQARGEKVDARADLFSLGVILYRLCTGELPFKGKDTMSTLMALALHEPPPPAQLNASLPGALSALVMQLLEKDPGKRPASAQEVVKTIQALEKNLGATPDKVKPGQVAIADPPLMSIPPPSDAPSPPRRRLAGQGWFGRWWNGPYRWPGLLGAFGALAMIVGTIVLLLPTKDGVIRMEINDPEIEVSIKGSDIVLRKGGREEITLSPGDHTLIVRRGDFRFETTTLILKSGQTVTVKVELLQGKVVVTHDGKTIGELALGASKPAATTSPAKPPSTQPMVLKPTVSAQGWTDLFNGRDLTGWQNFGTAEWVMDGTLAGGVLQGTKGQGWLATAQDYDDFELSLEYRLGKGGISGIFLRAWPEGAISGNEFLEIQLMDNSSPSFANQKPERKNGALYGLVAPASPVDLPPGEWHTVLIRMQGSSLEASFNGARQLSIDLAKLSAMHPGLNRTTGRIGLQKQGSEVEFYNVRVRRLTPAKPATNRAPPDAVEFAGRKYKFFPEVLTWKEAKKKCEEMGGHLAVVDSQEKHDFLWKLVQSSGKEDCWLGATDEVKEGEWVWVTGALMGYTNWHPGQPNNKEAGEHYLIMTSRFNIGGRWCDQPDRSEQHEPGFLCEWPP